jgi:IS4 transposase
MRPETTVMHDLLKPLPWARFEALVDKYEADRSIRTLSTKSQLIALLHAQLSGAVSLREVVATMASHQSRLYHLGAAAPKRSTLADANAKRPARLFAELFDALLAQAHRGLRKASQDAIRLIDATRIPLNALSTNWARYDVRSNGVKVSIVYDPAAAAPVRFAINLARENDMVPAKAFPIEAGATYVFDMGYYSFQWWGDLDAKGCRFVTRLKRYTPTRVVEERAVANDRTEGGRIMLDRVVMLPTRLRNARTHRLGEKQVREIHVVIDTGKTLRLVTNDLDASAEEIAGLYKTRWEIELFFRWVKQTLRIRKFLGTSENAVRIQIAVALIAYLLLRIAQAAQSAVEGLLTFARLVRANLMHRRSIRDLHKPPERTLQIPNQMELALC